MYQLQNTQNQAASHSEFPDLYSGARTVFISSQNDVFKLKLSHANFTQYCLYPLN